ncbi:hypothetical protein WJX81_001009 [Elliptochloris bilobata]|uniref:Uncharacterized protein n=1 Tax=Elliptochloris bilobata TaxID=381761 RepID=A0AAW1RSG9_9CHLO
MSPRLPGLWRAACAACGCWARTPHLQSGVHRNSAWVPWQLSRALLHAEPAVDFPTKEQVSADLPKRRDQAFVDKARLEVAAGHGGAGCVSIWKSSGKGKFQPADGGNGGWGGDVVIEACPRTRSLRALRHLQRAAPGQRGRKQRKGHFPELNDLEDDFSEGCSGGGWGEGPVGDDGVREELVVDLVEAGQRVVVARGGEGGRGNAAFRTGHNRPASRESEAGQPGEQAVLRLELKVLADVGLVGAPNAGKSTLLRALSAAQPAVAAYPFTTLRPQLGALRAGGPAQGTVIVADIPGLIAGAAANRGLGHAFLRHVERTQLLAYVVDLAGGLHGDEGPRAWDQLAMLQEELRLFSPALLARPSLVVANKVDKWLDGRGLAATLGALRRRTHLPNVPGPLGSSGCNVQRRMAVFRPIGPW